MAGNQFPVPTTLAEAVVGLPISASHKVGPDDDLAHRARAWFVEAMQHPLWTRYREQSKEDLGFYIGGENQWVRDGSAEDLEALKQRQKAIITVNHCQAIVDVLTGFERNNRFDLRASPQGSEDAQGAELWSWILKWVQDKTEFHELKSECFEDGIIRGMSCLHIGLDWTNDPVNGDIVVEVLTPGEDIIWDPRWTKYDLSDARYVIRFKWAYVEDLKAQYPEHADEIERGVIEVSASIAAGEPRLTTDGSWAGGDAYGFVRGHPRQSPVVESMFFDKDEMRALVLEVWYRTYETVWLVVNRQTHDIHEAESKAEAEEMAASAPDIMEVVRRSKRKIRMGVVIPATFQVLEEDDSPYENDSDNYPFVPYVAKRKGDDVYGVIRNLKDPQRVENKRISQIMDIIGRFANIKPMMEEDSLVNPRVLEDPASEDPLIVKRGRQSPGWYAPPLAELSRVLTELALQAKMNMREVSGINTDLLGFRSDDTSGIAIARRQAQGQVIATVFFDNLKRTAKIAGKRLAARAQQKFSSEEILRLTNAAGEPIVINLNPREYRTMTPAQFEEFLTSQTEDRRPKIIRDVSALKYDIVISEAPATPSARHTALLALLEMVGKMPALGPLIADKIVELADIPDKQAIVQRVRMMLPPPIQAAETQPPQGGAPTAPVAGAPQGAVPMPGAVPGAAPGPSVPPQAAVAPQPPPPQPPRRGGTSKALRRALAMGTGAATIGPVPPQV
ncbi:MAG TPA: hypothetical protein VNP04_27050 [Alphaproteobacteria bacterium]|nr:hypothetical protein [Alphaproteobacteria bacterium]